MNQKHLEESDLSHSEQAVLRLRYEKAPTEELTLVKDQLEAKLAVFTTSEQKASGDYKRLAAEKKLLDKIYNGRSNSGHEMTY